MELTPVVDAPAIVVGTSRSRFYVAMAVGMTAILRR
jgi:hypothetical protein